MSLLKYHIIKNGQLNQDDHALLNPEKKFEAKDNKQYKVKAITNSAIYEN